MKDLIMYIYVKSITLLNSLGSQWRETDIRMLRLNDIFRTFQKVYLVLKTPFSDDEIYVDLNALRLELSSKTTSLGEWLINVYPKTLPTVDSIPSTKIKYVKYSDAYYSGYRAELTKIGYNLNPYNTSKIDLPDIELTRPRYTTDLSLIHTHCLVTVNGLIHLTDTDGKRLFIYDAGKMVRTHSQNHIGIISFLDVGKLEKIKITDEMITRTDNDTPLKDRINIKLPETIDTKDKTVILVLGGYLVFQQNEEFFEVGDNHFVLRVKAIPLIERLLESRPYLDLRTLGLTEELNKPGCLSLDEVYSDIVLRKLLKLSQSHIVILDTKRLIYNRVYLHNTKLPGEFVSHVNPVYPLVVNYGKIVEYWKTYDEGRWSVKVADSYYRNFVYKNTKKLDSGITSSQLIPSKTFFEASGYLLEIGGYND